MKIGLAIVHLALIFCFVYLLGKRWNEVSSKIYWSAFLFRLMAGISLGLIYTYYYSASDTWQFFEDAKKLSTLARENFFSYFKFFFSVGEDQYRPDLVNNDLRSIFFIKIISLFCLMSLDNYWICAAYFSLLSFISAWGLHRKITGAFRDSFTASAVAFLFFPSVVFWSSGLEKESIALSGIYFLTILFLKLMTDGKPSKISWLLAIPVCFVVWSLKYYWMIIFFIAVCTAVILSFLVSKFLLIKKHQITVWVVLFFGIGIMLSFTHPNFYLYRFFEVIVSNYNDFAAISNPKNLIYYFQLDQTWTSILVNSPWALISGLFRPFPGEGQGLLGTAASLENFFLLILFVGAWANLKTKLKSASQIILLAVVSYCIVLGVFLALSTPNFGTLSRYRVGFLPFFVFLIAYRNPFIDWLSNEM